MNDKKSWGTTFDTFSLKVSCIKSLNSIFSEYKSIENMSFQTTINVCSGSVSEEFKSVLCKWHHLRSKRDLKGVIWGSTPMVFDASLFRKWTKSCDKRSSSEEAADHHLLNEKVWAVHQSSQDHPDSLRGVGGGGCCCCEAIMKTFTVRSR